MKLAFVPLLQLQRELYELPRGPERFARYRQRVHGDTSKPEMVCAPLLIVNPMARETVATCLDQWLALDAEAVAARTVADLSPKIPDAPGGCYQISVVLADDLGGGWTHRYAWEFSRRFERPPAFQSGWLSGVLWVSETPTRSTVVRAIREAIFREEYILRHGVARTLRNRLAQEGTVLARAGGAETWALDPEEVAYTREVLNPHLDSVDLPTAMSLLFGDPAARSLGYEPMGLSPWAGLALARHDAGQKVLQSA